SNVDFPAPLRPVSAIASPVRTSRLKRSKIVLGPKARRSPETFRMVVRLATWAFCPLCQAGQTARLNSDRRNPNQSPSDLEPRRCTLSPEERAQSRPTGLKVGEMPGIRSERRGDSAIGLRDSAAGQWPCRGRVG